MIWLNRQKTCKIAGIKLKDFPKLCKLIDSVWEENPTAYEGYLADDLIWDHALSWFLRHHTEMIAEIKEVRK
jgi:hypothetical protein